MVEATSSHSKDAYSEDSSIQRVEIGNDARDYVVLGKLKIYRHELQAALMDPLTVQSPFTPAPKTSFANPGPLGLCAFGITTFILCCYNARVGGITVPNAVLGMAVFYGGLAQFLAGIWEFFVGNTFGCTALTSYGAFWLAWGAIYIPSFGIRAAYADDPAQLTQAAGIFLTGWAIFTFMLTLLTFKTSVAFCTLFCSLTITFIFLAVGDYTGQVVCTKVGGVFGVITAFLAFYNAFAGVATKQNSYFGANVFPLTKKE
ncbi:Meiotically up-regulated protein 86 protein [Lodderomyces elongisporus]|uniref:Ammonia transport outward protein 2 n=1 Tax=Lodderomyces elongisporus (strain ATCC 11503 / CBS 2605 / JCM 1781 / NBRC 1676 / NRRL YB-4239) TaxID=379508 RepID=A5DT86_LODEL|nr:Meiotically up-regulated protein 86 protein [Lodderomyces elongisporus]EDK42394.1 hypothetical protein LELG_00572 [Lodderomyces elongisporus NRRL YB-4239]WLF76852.1 Meiotically up-regulated protein 86 protein [Lodderomyces elongisporus]